MSKRTLPVRKPRKPSPRVRDAIALLTEGRAKNIAAAARAVGIERETLSRALSAHPDFVKEKAARSVAVSSARAAGRLGELINRSHSEKVGLDASKFALQVAGIAPADGGVNFNVSANVQAGYVIVLSGRPGAPVEPGEVISSADPPALPASSE